MQSTITIKQVRNGFVLEYFDYEYGGGDGELVQRVYEIPDTTAPYDQHADSRAELVAMRRLLIDINEIIGPSTSRYSPERLLVTTTPGDKFVSEEEEEEENEQKNAQQESENDTSDLIHGYHGV